MPRKGLAAAGGIGSGQGSLVLDVERDSSHRNEPETNSQVADLLASLKATRAELVERIARLHSADGQADHGLITLLGRMHLAILAVEAEGGGDA